MTTTRIIGGRIIDGSGNPWFYGDLLIADQRIARIAPPGTLNQHDADTHIDATGQVVAPGFIDIQSHSIFPLARDGRALSKITQGVTTEIMGEDWTPAPFGGKIASPWGESAVVRLGEDLAREWDERARGWTRFGQWLDAFERRGTSVNIGSFLGGGTLREYGMAQAIGHATPDALAEMKRVTAEAMEDGAFGVATALIYPPSSYANTEELIEIMRVVAAYNGIHITHMRSEGDDLEAGFAEVRRIAAETGVSSEIYHLKAIGQRNWPKMPDLIDAINAARAEGLDITADMYPYEGAGTGLAACIPPWTAEHGQRTNNLRDPETRQRIIAEMTSPTTDWENFGLLCGPENIILAQLHKQELKKYQGKRLQEAADDLGLPWPEAICHLLATNEKDIFCMYLAMSTENLALQSQQPWMKFSTDAGGVDPEWAVDLGLQHPRAYGTYTRVLGRFVRENGWLSLEDAVRKSSSAVADRLGLRDRGLLREGNFADVIVFNPDSVIDNATYTEPHQLSTGIRDVLVNGTLVLKDGVHTDALPGLQVRGPGYRA